MRLYIYDLDGTVIDSSHRRKFDENGNLLKAARIPKK